MARKVLTLQRRAQELKAEVERLEALRCELRAQIVPYTGGGELVRRADLERHRIPIRRAERGDALRDRQLTPAHLQTTFWLNFLSRHTRWYRLPRSSVSASPSSSSL
jgi:hypothetical protein